MAGECIAGGMHGKECMSGKGHAWQKGVHGRGEQVWQGAFMAWGMRGRGHAWQGACMTGGRRCVTGRCVWWGGGLPDRGGICGREACTWGHA